ncbi:MAG: hypothetical protein ACYC4L_05825 [Chloroflexota bacterium]
MSTQVARTVSLNTYFIAAIALVLGIISGYGVLIAARPTAPEPALLWDDYIVATASLYQRDGDLEGAKERLQRLGVADSGQSVSALAAVYVPSPGIGETGAAALRNLALALTGRAVAAPGTDKQGSTQPQTAPGWQALVRNPLPWSGLCVLGLAWLGFSLRPLLARRAAGPKFASVPTMPTVPDQAVSAAALEGVPLAPTMPSSDTARGSRAAPTSLAVTLTYRSSGEPYEQMVPIADPINQRLVGGCGLATGPQAPGGGAGHIGMLVWLHDSASGEQPKTLGLVAAPATGAAEAALQEWMAFAHLKELLVARPGASWSFETQRLLANVYITDIGTVTRGSGRDGVITHLRAHVEVTFKGRRPSASDLPFSSLVGLSRGRR